MAPKYLMIEVGKIYKIIKRPDGVEPEGYNIIGMAGMCRWSSSFGHICLNISGGDVVVPADCVEKVVETPIEDTLLVTTIIDNPEKILKLLRGLWRMTKHPTIRDLMERGILPEDNNINRCLRGDSSLAPKTKDEYNQNWDEYLRSSGMIVSGC